MDGREIDFPAAARDLERCVPRSRAFRGWSQPTAGVRRWADLPAEARAYLEWVERACGVPITRVSVGAERDAEVPRG